VLSHPDNFPKKENPVFSMAHFASSTKSFYSKYGTTASPFKALNPNAIRIACPSDKGGNSFSANQATSEDSSEVFATPSMI
jgi:hypothetical protein